MPDVIDLRSDTVTRPVPAMLDAMTTATLGDDVLGDDPTVNALQERCAAMFGKEDACFVPSGTMANQLAIRAQTQPGDEVIIHRESHAVHYETGGAAAIAGVTFQMADGPRGVFDDQEVRRLIRPDDHHFAPTTLVCLENTHNRGGGSTWPPDTLAATVDAAHAMGLGVHLDGARIWNACVARGIEPVGMTAAVDTVSACFSKGLGAPAGSIVAGSCGTIRRVRRFRKMLGGAMRQTGLLAAAADWALDHHVERLVEDHANALQLAVAINDLSGLSCDLEAIETNIVFVDVDASLGDADAFCRQLEDEGVLAEALDPTRIRFVTHLDLSTEMVDRATEITAGIIDEVHAHAK